MYNERTIPEEQYFVVTSSRENIVHLQKGTFFISDHFVLVMSTLILVLG